MDNHGDLGNIDGLATSPWLACVFFKSSISVTVSNTNYETSRMRRLRPIGLFSTGSQSEIEVEALITLGDFR